jgi:hypothetical protein
MSSLQVCTSALPDGRAGVRARRVGPWDGVPRHAKRTLGHAHGARLVYDTLVEMAGISLDPIAPTNQEIADAAGRDIGTVRRALPKILAAGMIRYEATGVHRRPRRIVFLDANLGQSDRPRVAGRCTSAPRALAPLDGGHINGRRRALAPPQNPPGEGRKRAPSVETQTCLPLEDTSNGTGVALSEFNSSGERENVNVTCARPEGTDPTGGVPPAIPAPAEAETPPTEDQVAKLLAEIRNPRTTSILRGCHALRLEEHGLLPAELRRHLPPPDEPAPPPRPIAPAYPSEKPLLRTRLGKVKAGTPRVERASIADELADELGGDPDYYLAILDEVVAGRSNRLVVGYEKAKGRGVTGRSGLFGYYARGGKGGPVGPAITGSMPLTGGVACRP